MLINIGNITTGKVFGKELLSDKYVPKPKNFIGKLLFPLEDSITYYGNPYPKSFVLESNHLLWENNSLYLKPRIILNFLGGETQTIYFNNMRELDNFVNSKILLLSQNIILQ